MVSPQYEIEYSDEKVTAWLRPGNTGASSSAEHFLQETFGILGQDRIGLIRADSGFCMRSARWFKLKDGVEVCETRHAFSAKGKERRLILMRKDMGTLPRRSRRQLETWEDESLDSRYRYSAYYTSLELPVSAVWCLYRDRGDAENRIKELKDDFGIEGFHLKNFWETEAAFRFAILAYNLMSLFRQLVLQSSNPPTLATLPVKCFALGAWISTHARKRILKISLSPKNTPGSTVSSQKPALAPLLLPSFQTPNAIFGFKAMPSEGNFNYFDIPKKIRTV